jgi:hypothetical protein
MKKIYQVVDEQIICQYTIEVESVNDCTKYTLKYSQIPEWSNPGETILTITDTGNGFEFSDEYSTYVDYHVFAQYYILMSFIKRHDDQLMPNYKFTQELSLTNID